MWRFSPVEDVVDLAADVGTQAQELAVDAVQNGLQEVSLSRVFAVEQLQELPHKRTVRADLEPLS